LKEKKMRILKGRRLASTAAVIGVLVMAVITVCAAGSSARLDRSKEVLNGFLAGTVLPGYTYYTTGVENNPDAILGIKEGITLKTGRWKEREITEQFLRRMVGAMNSTYSAVSFGLLGSAVLNDQGEQIGVWYSPAGTTTVEMLGPTEVRVSPPSAVQIQRLLGD
jgi:hypothetical protein